MKKLFFKPLLLSSFFLLISTLDNGFKAEELVNDEVISDVYFPTHPKIPKPLSVNDTNALLVSLQAYLGKQDMDTSQVSHLELVSAGTPLLLKDANGLVHKSSKISIGWRKVPLKSSKVFERQVIGPFPSFESAQRISSLLEEDGIVNVIAHPLDWEIWVAKQIPLPKTLKSKVFREKVFHEVKPVLKLGFGEYFLSGKIFIEAPDGLLWKNGLYQGPFFLKPDAYGTWTFLEKVSIEKYLLGVLPHEIGSSSPPNALAAQAVLARTWAISNSHRFEIDGYHLCTDTQCQVYKDPSRASEAVARAIKQTNGKVLNWEGKPINAVYHATNGGVSAAGHEAWSIAPVPYLRTFVDGPIRWKNQFDLPLDDNDQIKRLLAKRDGAFGNGHRLFRWKRTVTAKNMKKLLNLSENEYPKIVRVLERGPSGRVLALEIAGKMNKSKLVLRLDGIRRKFKNLPSTLFFVEEVKDGVWEFTGGGFGHGAGLSQAGAIDLALRGWTTRKILKYYYPGTSYESFK
ncbi:MULTISPECIES: SpoIID/LytB domain-containing protein [unclassified Prochlorococcus]|uniref:SpoIID/LytB domain-containing protein n=1 Tax=unclassified Prochlorococcus TaxID=2627481 RepID=UPI0005338214|nr:MULTISPECIES: SpoIID/LytB domain-containing protein [unclassified Prochlorococcus]KGG14563.1 putative amidase enhancer [Prochlorococcus sp. MIT 0602]KGG16011.1 putative amidase enhancer [Prochlorococcus sp. MIT 0603]